MERAHIIPHTRSYNNGYHSYGVATLCHLLWPDDPHLVVFALFHDTPERWTGDMPSTMIRVNDLLRTSLREEDERISSGLKLPSEHALAPEDFIKLKAADKLELWLWTYEEEALGNQMVLNCRSELDMVFDNDPNIPTEVLDVVTDIRSNGWRRHREVY